MNKLVTTAIIGTGQQATTDLSTGTAVDALTKQMTHDQPERTLLLAAGAWALYQQAGYSTQSSPLSQQPALAEQKTACSANAAQIISGLLQGKHDVLLPKALERLQRAQQRLPHDLLPSALVYGTKHKQLQTALLPVLGERGRWLAQFSPEWNWATSTDTAFKNKPLTDVEVLWQEQTLPQRVEILRHLRTIEPDTAREWLASVWKQEKAEARASLLSSLEVNLSEKDEAFLEQALNDRGKSVCAQAIQLLAALPTSAFNQRMKERADTLLHYENGLLHITVTNKFDPNWRRDGITQDSKSKNLTPDAFLHIISQIPPSHWEERFGPSLAVAADLASASVPTSSSEKLPALLIEAASASEKTSDGWMQIVVKGWTIAAEHYNATSWFEPLVNWWLKHDPEDSDEYIELFKLLPQDRAEQHILSHMFAGTVWIEELIALPPPWSSSFSRSCLQTLQQNAVELAKNNNNYTYYYKAAELMNTIATALPPDCFDIALAEWTFSTDSKDNNWYAKYWNDQVNNLKTLLRLRTKIQKEIAQ
jgi:hypothetical protein